MLYEVITGYAWNIGIHAMALSRIKPGTNHNSAVETPLESATIPDKESAKALNAPIATLMTARLLPRNSGGRTAWDIGQTTLSLVDV